MSKPYVFKLGEGRSYPYLYYPLKLQVDDRVEIVLNQEPGQSMLEEIHERCEKLVHHVAVEIAKL